MKAPVISNMLYKIKTRKPSMSEGDRLIIAFMVLFFVPFVVGVLIEVVL